MKKIFNSLREDNHLSVYMQKQTLQELYGTTILIESIMNSRPILSISKSHEALMLTPKELMFPYLTADQVKHWVTQAMLGITGLLTSSPPPRRLSSPRTPSCKKHYSSTSRPRGSAIDLGKEITM